MQIKLKQWGNSQGIRFSREFLTAAGIRPDDVLDVRIENGNIVLSKSFQHRTLQERAAEFGGKLNLSREADFGEPQGNEVW